MRECVQGFPSESARCTRQAPSPAAYSEGHVQFHHMRADSDV
uniref:Uncharacterized protein n=1 Tax=Arundo donax TaxID=35708 RepID=A0A0A9F8W3_ARUDO